MRRWPHNGPGKRKPAVPRDGAPGRNCWSARRIGDLNPGGPQGPTALAVLFLSCRDSPGITAIVRNRRSAVPERRASCQALPGMPSAYGRAMATHPAQMPVTAGPLPWPRWYRRCGRSWSAPCRPAGAPRSCSGPHRPRPRRPADSRVTERPDMRDHLIAHVIGTGNGTKRSCPGYLVACRGGCQSSILRAGRADEPRSPVSGRLVVVHPHLRSARCDTLRSPAPVTPAARGQGSMIGRSIIGRGTAPAADGYAASPSGP